MRYQRSFRVGAPLPAVVHFHQSMDSFKALTPPPIFVQLHRAPEIPRSGDQMEFTLWLGPLPIRWLAEFRQVSQQGFLDVQLKGPFQQWEHRHRFTPMGDGITEIGDSIEFKIGWSLLTPIALGMTLGLPLLFAYRAWRTRRELEGSDRGQ